MANLNIGASLATVNTLASLPVDKGTIYATLSAPTNISLVSAMHQGQIMEVVINPTATFLQTVPTTGGFYSTFGDTLPLSKNCRMVLTITCIGSGQYLLSYDSNAGEKYNGYDYVDLGLPSGLLWATCNVGASQPQEYGKYFQWGATEGYYSGTTAAANSSWATAPFNNGNSSCNDTYFDSVSGSVCPNYTLSLQYDAARANMGGEWRMPTADEFQELITNTTYVWSRVGTSDGIMLTSKSDTSKTIFFPAAGYFGSSSHISVLSSAYIATSSLYPLYKAYTYSTVGLSNRISTYNQMYRFYAMPVRGVLQP